MQHNKLNQLVFFLLLFIIPFKATANFLAAGSGHSCAILAEGKITCWGNPPAAIKAPAGKFVDIAAGRAYTCGILADDNTVKCWGSAGYGQITETPLDTFTQVAAGTYHNCAIRTDKTIACWGKKTEEDYGQSNPPEGNFLQVSVGMWHSCGVKTDGKVACWGTDKNPFSKKGEGQATPPDGKFLQVAAGLGGWHTCGIRADNHQVQCWGLNDDTQSTPVTGEFAQISAGKYFTCGVRLNNTIACWGWSDYGQVNVPESNCIVRDPDHPKRYECTTTEEDDDKYIFVAAGLIHTCAIKVDNTVACWGKGDKGQTSPPVNTVVKSSQETAPKIKLAIELNQSIYHSGEQFTFNLNTMGGIVDQLYDLYAAIVFPQGYFLTISDPLSFSELDQVQPYKTKLDLSTQQTFSILNLKIPDDIEIGTYRACGVVTLSAADPNDIKNRLDFVCKPFTIVLD